MPLIEREYFASDSVLDRKHHLEASYLIFYIDLDFIDIEIGESVVQHYESIRLIEINAKSLLECICNCFRRDDIPLQNLVSYLSDNTNYMRGGGR